MRNRATSRALGACVLLLVAGLAAAAVPRAKRPLSHRDYDAWRTISSQVVSRDGHYLAYAFMPQEGDGELVIRDLNTGQERREAVGALPPPVIQPAEEVNPEEPPQRRSIRIAITSDSRFLVATTFPSQAETEQAKKQKKKPEEMPKGGLVVVNLATGEANRVGSVKSMQVPSKGGSWLAYLKEAKAEEKKPEGEDKKAEEKPAEGARPAAGRGRGAGRKEYGTDLVVRDLARGPASERVFPAVTEYTFARDGQTLLFAVSSRKEEDNGLFAVIPGSEAAPVALAAGKGKYAKLTWDREQRRLAFVTDRDDAAAKTPRFKAYLWDRGSPAAAAVVGTETAGLPAELPVSDKGSLAFSRDGSRLYVPTAPPARAEADGEEAPADEKVLADLWHWKDDIIQPMQRVRANQERNRTYRGVYHIADKKYVQLADPSLRTATLSDDGRRAFGFDDRAYRRLVDYDGSYSDVYLVDTLTGTRKAVLQKIRGGFGGGGGQGGGGGGGGPLSWSPDGAFAFYYQDKHWHLLDTASGSSKNMTGALGVALQNEDHDTPDAPGSYGNAGWTKDSRSFLAYDRYDVWQLFADGRPARNLTGGEGRRTRTELRVQRIEPVEEDDDVRGLDPAQPLYLRGASEETRATGFFKTSFTASGPPQRLLWGDKNYRFSVRAQEADVLLLTASRFDEYPDLLRTDSSFRTPLKLTSGGAQRDAFLWGASETVSFKSADGVPLRATLFKPEGFDPGKRYPMMVYIYERLSQNLHNFVNPAPGTSINIAYYVSNGYLVLTPDIVYTIGHPGQSALKCVLPAIQEVVDRGFVDEKAIGIQGHSWGGYQIAYMLTQTNRFRAAEAGAPVANMTSAYSGIRWGSGLPRQFQYEKTQSRIARPLYEAPHKYIENSPVFQIDRVTTPLLILHNDQDDAVPWYQGIELFLALRRHGKEAYLWNYNGEFHGLRRRHNQRDYTVRMQQFFDHYLKGAPQPEWMGKGVPFLEREAEKTLFQKESDR